MSSRTIIVLGIIGSILFMGAGLAPIFFGPGFTATFAVTSDTNAALQNAGNLGQFLSGLFAPVAFVWVVLAVFLQGRELELQREELGLSRRALELQADELKNSVEQLKAQAEVLSKQFNAQQEQKAFTNILEGVRGICSIIIEKFSGNGMEMTSAGELTAAAWFSPNGLTELLENENYTFLVSEITQRMDRRTRSLEGQLKKISKIRFSKIPLLSEMDSIILHINRTLEIPQKLAIPDLSAKFDLEYPLEKLLHSLKEVRDFCANQKIAKP